MDYLTYSYVTTNKPNCVFVIVHSPIFCIHTTTFFYSTLHVGHTQTHTHSHDTEWPTYVLLHIHTWNDHNVLQSQDDLTE